jgi:hypothetical protein
LFLFMMDLVEVDRSKNGQVRIVTQWTARNFHLSDAPRARVVECGSAVPLS